MNLKSSLSRKRSISNNYICSWIDNTFKKRECDYFIPSLYPLTITPAERKCGCGLNLMDHPESVVQAFRLKHLHTKSSSFDTNDIPIVQHSNFKHSITCSDIFSQNKSNILNEERKINQSPYNLIKLDSNMCWNPQTHTRLSPTNANGIIKFQGTSHRHQAQYLRLAYDTPPEDIIHLFITHWGIDLPKLLISVHGGLENFDINPKLLNLFQTGLIKAAGNTITWIFTIGLNGGYVKYVGDAIYDLPCKNRSNIITIGIAPWGIVQNREELIGKDKTIQYYSSMPHLANTLPLNSDHTYFLLADDGTVGKFGCEYILRRNLEKCLMKYNIHHANFLASCCQESRNFTVAHDPMLSDFNARSSPITPINIYNQIISSRLQEEEKHFATDSAASKRAAQILAKTSSKSTNHTNKKTTDNDAYDRNIDEKKEIMSQTNYYHTLPTNSTLRRRPRSSHWYNQVLTSRNSNIQYHHNHRLSHIPTSTIWKSSHHNPSPIITTIKTKISSRKSSKSIPNINSTLLVSTHPFDPDVNSYGLMEITDPSSLHKKSLPTKFNRGSLQQHALHVGDPSEVSNQPHRHSYPESNLEGGTKPAIKSTITKQLTKLHTNKETGLIDGIEGVTPIVAVFINGNTQIVKNVIDYVNEWTLTPTQSRKTTKLATKDPTSPTIKAKKAWRSTATNNQKRFKVYDHSTNNTSQTAKRVQTTASPTLNGTHCSSKPVPIIIIEGSGGMSDIISYVCRQNIDPEDSQFSPTIQNVLEKMIHKNWPLEDGDTHLQIILSDLFHLTKYKKIITLYGKESGSKSLDHEILCALLRTYRKKPLDQLYWALAWNRADVAKSEIFVYGQHWPEGTLELSLMKALAHDQVDFVKLLLENGIHLSKFLTVARLEKLYNSKYGPPHTLHFLVQDIKKNIPLNYWYSLIDIGIVIDKLMGGVYRSSYGSSQFKQIYYRYKQSLQQTQQQATAMNNQKSNKFLEKSSLSTLFLPNKATSSDIPGDIVCEFTEAFVHPFHDLMVWALLTQRHNMSLYFWEMGEEPLPKALMATKLCKSLAKEAAQDDLETDISEKCFHYAKTYASLALTLLDKCYQTKPDFTEQLLTYRLKHFSDQTSLSLAYAANHLEFIAHSCCQFLLGDLWMGGLRMRKSSAIKVIMGLAFPCTILTLEFKTLAELQLMPQTLEEHINELEQEEDEDDDSDPDFEDGEDALSLPDFDDNDPNMLENKFKSNNDQDSSKDDVFVDGIKKINFENPKFQSPKTSSNLFPPSTPTSKFRRSFKKSIISLLATTPSRHLSMYPFHTTHPVNSTQEVVEISVHPTPFTTCTVNSLAMSSSSCASIKDFVSTVNMPLLIQARSSLDDGKFIRDRNDSAVTIISPDNSNHKDEVPKSIAQNIFQYPADRQPLTHSEDGSGGFITNALSKSLKFIGPFFNHDNLDDKTNLSPRNSLESQTQQPSIKHGSYYSQMLANHQHQHSLSHDESCTSNTSPTIKFIDPSSKLIDLKSCSSPPPYPNPHSAQSNKFNWLKHLISKARRSKDDIPSIDTLKNVPMITITSNINAPDTISPNAKSHRLNLFGSKIDTLQLPTPSSAKKKRSTHSTMRRKSQGDLRKPSVFKKLSQNVPKITNFKAFSQHPFRPNLSPVPPLMVSSSTKRLNARTKFYEFYNAPITKFWCHTLAYFFFIFVFTHVVLVGNTAYILRDPIYQFNRTSYLLKLMPQGFKNHNDPLFYLNFSRNTAKNHLDESYPHEILSSRLIRGHVHLFASWTEIFVIAYIFTFACEKLREAISNEAVGFSQKTKLWFRNIWNTICLAGFILFCVSLALKISAAESLNRYNFRVWRAHRTHKSYHIEMALLRHVKSRIVWARFFNALSSVFWYIRILDLLGCNKFFGPLVVMIGKMMMDMMIFVMIMVVIMASFGIARYSIRNPDAAPSLTIVKDIFYQPYWMMYGEVFAPDINPDCGKDGMPPCIIGDWITPALMALYLLVTNILLVNLLIAVFNQSFVKVNAISQQIWKFGRFSLTMEYEMKPILPPPFIIFCHIYRLYKYFQIRKKYGPADIDSNFDYGLKLYLSDEEVSKLHEFEKSCMDDLVYEKEYKTQETLDKRLARTTGHIENLSSKLDDLYLLQTHTTDDFTTIEKRLKGLETTLKSIDYQDRLTLDDAPYQQISLQPNNQLARLRNCNITYSSDIIPNSSPTLLNPNVGHVVNRMNVMKYGVSNRLGPGHLSPRKISLRPELPLTNSRNRRLSEIQSCSNLLTPKISSGRQRKISLASKPVNYPGHNKIMDKSTSSTHKITPTKFTISHVNSSENLPSSSTNNQG